MSKAESGQAAEAELVQIRPVRSPAAQGGVYIKTFGCQMNEYDSEKLYKLLDGSYQRVEDPADARVVIVNTCSVREKPEHKLYSLLGQLELMKRESPDLLIGVGGCVAQQEGKKIVDRCKGVDFVFGTHNLSVVPSLIERRRAGSEPQVAVDYRDEWEELPQGFVSRGRVSQFIAISRGCNKNCTYCIVPTTRGKEVSRPIDELLREIRIAVHGGVREVVLLGQTVNSYGLDLQPRIRFADLLERVAQIDGVRRIRFTSPHPQEIRRDFVDLVVRNPKVCRHLHMPLQSGSNRVLKLMNRNYRRERYLEIIEQVRAAAPDMAFTTDIIVGFPGETEADFQDTLDVVRTVGYYDSYSFMFSPRPGTVAAGMADDVPPEEKLRRLQAVQALQLELHTAYLESMVGREVEILVEGPSALDPQRLQGRTSQNVVCNLLEPVPGLAPGEIVPVTVTVANRHTLGGVPSNYSRSVIDTPLEAR